MTVSSGFFNSKSSDRKYDAKQMGQIFDGIINDGVYGSIYNQFAIRPGTGMQVLMDTGRAWFRHVWVLNDAVLPYTVPAAEVLTNRIDAVVIEIDHSESNRRGTTRYIKGTPSASPVRPVMTNTNLVRQYPLAFIRVNKGVTSITAGDITNVVGIDPTNIVTGPLNFMSIDQIVSQWQFQWNDWLNDRSYEFDEKYNAINKRFNDAFNEITNVWTTWFAQVKVENTQHISDLDTEFRTWWDSISTILDGDIAANLAQRILALEQYNKDKETQASARGAAYEHRNTYRGKNLGDTMTDEQLTAIKDGTFDDLYLGDYWTRGGWKYTIADFNYIDPTESKFILHYDEDPIDPEYPSWPQVVKRNNITIVLSSALSINRAISASSAVNTHFWDTSPLIKYLDEEWRYSSFPIGIFQHHIMSFVDYPWSHTIQDTNPTKRWWAGSSSEKRCSVVPLTADMVFGFQKLGLQSYVKQYDYNKVFLRQLALFRNGDENKLLFEMAKNRRATLFTPMSDSSSLACTVNSYLNLHNITLTDTGPIPVFFVAYNDEN